MNSDDINGHPLPAAAAAAAGNIPSFLDDPGTCLNHIANRPASQDLWNMLGGTVAACMKAETNPQLCALYLQAVAQQLAASDNNQNNNHSPLLMDGSGGGVAAAVVEATNHHNNSNNMEVEMVRAQRLYEILEAVGLAAAHCVPRQVISQTGILRALLSHPSHHQQQQQNTASSSILTPVQVEFCQVALLAEQYRFAARALEGTWPRPAADASSNNNNNSTLSVRHVLRYFLLRGMIHVGCNDWTMATRCFGTCLSVPAEIPSALGIAAWKKMVLVQCLQMEDDDYKPSTASSFTPPTEYAKTNPRYHKRQHQQQESQHAGGMGGGFSMMGSGSGNSNGPGSIVAIMARGPLSLPKAIPSCFTRFLNTAASNSKQQQQKQQHNQPEEMEHGSMIVQEDLGEPSSEQQQHASAQQPQQQEQPAYPAMGVRVYMDLVHAFLGGNREKFESLQQQHATLLQSDGTMGLVRQCETAMFHRQVYQLSRMYAVIPLTQLATKLKIQSAEKTKELLEQLAVTKTCGTNKKHCKWPSIEVEDDGMVVFDFAPSANDDKVGNNSTMDSTEQELDDNIKELMQLTKQVEGLDHNILATPMYHAMVRRNNDAKMAGPRGVDEM